VGNNPQCNSNYGQCNGYQCCTNLTGRCNEGDCDNYPTNSKNCLDEVIAYILRTSEDDVLWSNDLATQRAIQFYIQNANENLKPFIQKLLSVKNIKKLRDEELGKLTRLCNMSPGACDDVLNDYCKAYSRQDMLNFEENTNVSGIPIGQYKNQLCGCHMSSKVYDEYKQTLQGQSPQCDPLCLFPNAVPREDPNNKGSFEQCDQTVCIIDDVTINIGRGINNEISFTNMCGNCSDGMCKCIFGDINVSENGIKSLENVDFNLHCGNDCWIRNDDGSITPLANCKDVKKYLSAQGGIIGKQLNPNSFITLEILFGVFMLIFLLTLFFYLV